MVYEYSWSGYEQKVSAQIVGEHLKTLEAKHGRVTRELLLDSAKHKESPVHSLFEWDDTKAAEKFRLHQATVIICSLRVTAKEENTEPVVVRAYVTADPHQEVSSYFNVHDALKDSTMRKKVLAMARREAEAFRRKYKSLVELAHVIEAINDFVGKEYKEWHYQY